MNYANRTGHKIAAAAAGILVSTGAFALPPATVADLTTGVSFADVGLGILAISAALAAYAVIKMGAKQVLSALGIKFGG